MTPRPTGGSPYKKAPTPSVTVRMTPPGSMSKPMGPPPGSMSQPMSKGPGSHPKTSPGTARGRKRY